MAKLPDINSLGPRPTPRGNTSIATYRSGAVADAVGGLAGAMSDMASQIEAAEKERQKARAASELANLTNDLHDIHDSIGRDVESGALQTGEALQAYQKRAEEARNSRTQGLDDFQKGVIDTHLISVNGKMQRNLEGVILNRTRAETGANLISMSESLQRAAMRNQGLAVANWDKAVDSMGPSAGWDPAKMAAEKLRFKEVASFNVENARLEGAAQTGDIEMVRAARARIEGPDGEAIDPARRTALITKAYAFENGIQAAGLRAQEKAQREAEARENKARAAFDDAQNVALNGQYLDTETISRVAELTAGTSVAPAFQALVKSQSEIAGFASLPISEQETILERRRAAAATAGVGTSPEAAKMTDIMERITDGTRKAYAENPWQAAQERSVIENAPAADLIDVPTAHQVIASRMQQIDEVEAAAERRISPLQPQEAEKIGRLVRALPPDQQSAALAEFGSALKNADRVAALARQIDAKDKVLGTAMMYANSQTTQGRFVSELIVRGATAVKDGAVKVDGLKETGWRASIAKEIGDAYPNQEARDRVIDAAYWIKAGLTADGSVQDSIENAVRLATGGIVERNGSKIPLPYGMREDDFEKRISSISSVDLAAQAPDGVVRVGKASVPLDQFVKSLPNAALVHAGQGRYNVRAGMGLVTNEQGQRITIEVRNAR